jgi:hypothetical protein
MTGDSAILSDGANISDHLPIQFTVNISVSSIPHGSSCHSRTALEYHWDKRDPWNYYQHTGAFMQKVVHDWPCLSAGTSCCSTDRRLNIEIYYNEIVQCLNEAAMLFIPRIPSSALKHYWCVALDDLKQESILARSIWRAAGSPRTGVMFERKKSAHYKYKLAIKDCASQFADRFNCELLDCYMQKDMHTFWRKKNSKVIVSTSHVEGLSSDANIVEAFADYFKQPFAGVQSHVYEASVNMFACNDIDRWLFDVAETDSLIASHLKCGKAAGIDNITDEHILYAHPALISYLTKLFNLSLIHGFVPGTFGSGEGQKRPC